MYNTHNSNAENENHIKLQPCQNMMLHSSEPSLIQQNTAKELAVGRTITNSSGTRDASTSTVPKNKHMVPLASAPSIPKENQPISGAGVGQFQGDLNKSAIQDDQRFQASRLDFFIVYRRFYLLFLIKF